MPFPDWKLEVIFKDSVKGIYDMSQSIGEGMLYPLKDQAKFSQEDRVFQEVTVPKCLFCIDDSRPSWLTA